MRNDQKKAEAETTTKKPASTNVYVDAWAIERNGAQCNKNPKKFVYFSSPLRSFSEQTTGNVALFVSFQLPKKHTHTHTFRNTQINGSHFFSFSFNLIFQLEN